MVIADLRNTATLFTADPHATDKAAYLLWALRQKGFAVIEHNSAFNCAGVASVAFYVGWVSFYTTDYKDTVTFLRNLITDEVFIVDPTDEITLLRYAQSYGFISNDEFFDRAFGENSALVQQRIKDMLMPGVFDGFTLARTAAQLMQLGITEIGIEDGRSRLRVTAALLPVRNYSPGIYVAPSVVAVQTRPPADVWRTANFESREAIYDQLFANLRRVLQQHDDVFVPVDLALAVQGYL